jgi:PAS domain S-box-containing protein
MTTEPPAIVEEPPSGPDSRERLLAGVPGVICQFTLSPGGKPSFLSASEGAATILGVTAEQLVATPECFFARIHPVDLPRLLESFQQSALELKPWSWDGRLVLTGLRVRWLRGRARPKQEEDGSVIWNGLVIDTTDEREDTEKLRRNRDRFELAVNGSSAGIWDWEITTDKVYFSPRWKEMLGYKDHELSNEHETWQELIHAEDRPKMQDALDRYLRNEADTFEVEYRMWHRDASYRWILARGAALRDAEGRPQRMAGSHTDLTAWKRAEERLRLLESAIFHATDAVIITEAEPVSDPGPRIVYVNEAFCRQTGYRPEEILGETPRVLQGPRTDRATLDRLRAALDNWQHITVELVNYRKDGSDYWVEFSLVPIADKAGIYTHWVSVQRDITERKKADAIQKAFLSLGLLLSSAATPQEAASILADEADSILGWDAFSLMLYDAAASRLSDVLSVDVVEGRPTVLSGEKNYEPTPMLRRVMESGSQLINRARPEESSAGPAVPAADHRALSLLFVPIRRGREAFGVLTVQSYKPHAYRESDLVTLQAMADYAAAALERMKAQEDLRRANESLEERVHLRTEQLELTNQLMRMEISERQRVERELDSERQSLAHQVEERTRSLSQANAELAKAARLKDEFLASMSHELRTPLNSVLGLSEALIEEVYGPLNEKQRGSLNSVNESGRHLLSLINDILDLSKIEAGKMRLDPETFEVRDVCESSLRFVKEAAQKKKLSLSLKLGGDVDTLFADERRLKQMLVNLLSNAVKFTPDGGSVGLDVLAEPDPAVIRFIVWDTGIGIAEKDMPKLFQSFVQLDSSLSREYSGTGLGLALVRRMAELHGGSVGVESVPGQGSRFSIVLPVRKPDEGGSRQSHTEFLRRPKMSAPLAPAGPAAPGQPLVLIAEDSEANVITLRDYLLKHGFRLIFAVDGIQAVERTLADRPDLILMDVQMPNKDGLEAMREIRAHQEFANTPIIAVTALAMTGDRERCLTAGANDYQTKPVSLKGLVAAMNRLLGRTP